MGWVVLIVVSFPALVFGLLALTELIERTVLSPRWMVVRAVRVRSTPEHAEQLVADECERMLRAAEATAEP